MERMYFGMKVHSGVGAGSGYVHTITDTSANVHDVSETSKLLREDDHVAYGDSGSLGASDRPEIKDDGTFKNGCGWSRMHQK